MREWVFEGVGYPTRREMCAARRRRYVELLETGMNFTQAALAVGVSKRTGKVWRNGRTRSTGRNEKPVVDWYRSTVDKPRRINELVKLFVFGVCFINKVPFVRGMRPRVGRGPVSSWSSCAPR